MRRLHGVPLLVALLVGVGLVPAVVRADTTPPPVAPPEPPRSLVIGLSLGNPRLQAGVVRGRDVILARGFEVELARILARRLGGRVEGFVYVPSAPRLLASAFAGWHLAIGGIHAVGGRSAAGDATTPYLTTDMAVVSRRGLARPRGLADLRRVLVCAVRGSESARVVGTRVRPRRVPLLVAGPERLATVLRTGACDAALVPAVEAGRFMEGRKRQLGPVVGRIAHGKGFAMLVRRGTGLDVTRGRPRARPPRARRDARAPRPSLAGNRPRRASHPSVGLSVHSFPMERSARDVTRLVAGGALALFLLGLGIAVARGLDGDNASAPSPPTALTPEPKPKPVPAARPARFVQLTAAGAFDPEGDGRERDEEAALAVDGRKETAWRTERYSRFFKAGVGLVLDAGRRVRVEQVVLDTPTPGFRAEIRLGNTRGGPFATAAPAQTLTARTRFAVPGRAGRFVVVWVVGLPPESAGEIAEVRVRARG